MKRCVLPKIGRPRNFSPRCHAGQTDCAHRADSQSHSCHRTAPRVMQGARWTKITGQAVRTPRLDTDTSIAGRHWAGASKSLRKRKADPGRQQPETQKQERNILHEALWSRGSSLEEYTCKKKRDVRSRIQLRPRCLSEQALCSNMGTRNSGCVSRLVAPRPQCPCTGRLHGSAAQQVLTIQEPVINKCP